MSFTQRISTIVMVAAVLVLALPAEAASQDRAERRAAREAERIEREVEREARRAVREAERAKDSEDEEESVCRARVSLKMARPQLTWRSGVLHFVPTFDVAIRTSGEPSDGNWTAQLAMNGRADFDSTDVTPPSGFSFSGSRAVFSGSCGTDYYHSGLTAQPLPLTGVVAGLVGVDQELMGSITLDARLGGDGLASETVAREFDFTVEAFGNLETGRWGRIRD